MASEARVRCGPYERGYDEVRGRVARIASGMHGLGVVRGDRVALVLRNDIPFLEISLAAGILGAVPVPVNWHWKDAELRHLLVDSGSTLVFAHSDLMPAVQAALPPGVAVVEVAVAEGLAGAYGLAEAPTLSGRFPDLEGLILRHEPWAEPPTGAPLAMIYTSGTTGTPKGIERAPVAPEQNRRIMDCVFTTFGIRPGHRVLLPAPLYHTAPNTHAMIGFAAGLDLTIMPSFDAEEMLRLIDTVGIHSMQVVPTMFVRLLRLPADVRGRYDVSSLESVVHAAAPCPQQVKREIIEWFGPIVLEYYGGSETGLVVWCDTPQWLAHPGTVGAPIEDADVHIIDADGAILPAGQSGEVFLKPPSFWPDFIYRGDQAKRAAIERDGYVSVGDIGYLDDDGFLYLNDRVSDMVISGGVNTYPAEIEQCVTVLPGVRDVAVFGIPDPEYGEALAAHVDTDPHVGLTEADIKDHVRNRLAGYKVPKVVVLDHNLPREDTGKLFKRRLRERYLVPTH